MEVLRLLGFSAVVIFIGISLVGISFALTRKGYQISKETEDFLVLIGFALAIIGVIIFATTILTNSATARIVAEVAMIPAGILLAKHNIRTSQAYSDKTLESVNKLFEKSPGLGVMAIQGQSSLMGPVVMGISLTFFGSALLLIHFVDLLRKIF